MSADAVAGEPAQERFSASSGLDTTVTLRSRRLQISPLAAPDIDAFVAYRRDPAVARYQTWDPDYDTRRALRLVADQPSAGLPVAGRWVQLALRERSSGRLVGDVGVHTLADQPDTDELGVTLDPTHQGRGLAREALARVLDLLFHDARAHRVTATCDLRNAAAARLLARLGMRHEARLVGADWFKGEWTTIDTYGVLARAWQGPRPVPRGAAAASGRTQPGVTAGRPPSRPGQR